jgi:hypothetical protein
LVEDGALMISAFVTTASTIVDRQTERFETTAERFVGHVEPAFGEQFLHVAVAQREADIEPNRVLDA